MKRWKSVVSAASVMLLAASLGCQPAAPTAAPTAAQASKPAATVAPNPPQPAATTVPASAAQQPGAGQPRPGGTLIMAMEKDIALMNPLVRTESTDQVVRALMFEPLLGVDAQGNLTPKLAEKWTVSADGKTVTFSLRQGVKFHNGAEMTAEDAKFAMDYTMNPKNAAYGFSQLEIVQSVEATDKHSLKVTLKQSSAAFLTSMSSIQAFSVVPKGSLQEGTDKAEAFPPGTGPFKYVEWKPKQESTFQRFDGYWGQKAYIDRVVIRPTADATVRFTALRAGDVEMIDRTPYEWVTQVQSGQVKQVAVAEALTAAFRTLVFNVASPPFDNGKLRQAVAHALDKAEILQAAYFGFGKPTDQIFPAGHAWNVPNLPFPQSNLDRAKALLQEAGYNGAPIALTIANRKDQQAEAAVVQAQLKKIGMNVTIDSLDAAAYFDRHRVGSFAFTLYGGNVAADPGVTYGSTYTCNEDLNKRSSNISGYCDREQDALLRQLGTEADQAKRKAILEQFMSKIAADVPDVSIGFAPRYWAFRDHVKGFTTDGEGNLVFEGGGLNYAWLAK